MSDVKDEADASEQSSLLDLPPEVSYFTFKSCIPYNTQ